MDHQNHNHNNGANNGFLMGVIVGGVVTLLFTTKKGREIVRDIVDKGLDKFYDLENAVEEKEEELIEIEGDDYIEPERVEKIKLAKEVKSEKTTAEKSEGPSQKSTRVVKRFFRKKT